MQKTMKVREVPAFLQSEYGSDGQPVPKDVILFVGPDRFYRIQSAGYGNRFRMSWADSNNGNNVKRLSRIVDGDKMAILLLPDPKPAEPEKEATGKYSGAKK